MPKLDDLLRDELREAAPRAELPDDIFERLGTRRRRRKVVRRATSAALAVAVLAASAGAFVALDRAFTGNGTKIANPPAMPENGDLVVSAPDDPGVSLHVLPADAIPAPGGAADRSQLRPLWSRSELLDLWPNDAPLTHAGATISPDGHELVFYDPSEEGNRLWRAGVDGTELRPITRASLDAWQPAWSPDGRWIAFIGRDAARAEQVFIVRPDGSDVRPVTDGQLLFLTSVTWSPDGASLAVSAVEEFDTAPGPRSVFTLPVTGMTSPERTEATNVGNGVAWSPDGRWIAFADSGIKLLDVETGQITTLTDPVAEGIPGASSGDAYDADPTWSPDGTLVAFSRFTKVDESVVHAVRADGSGSPYPLVVGRDPAWQPLPSAPESPEPTVESTELAGVPFPVCRPMSMPGTFGPGVTTAWLFEKAPQAGCEGYEGFQYIGLGTQDRVISLSGPLGDIGQNEVQLWPVAAPDVDGDGIAELAVGIEGSRRDGYLHSVLFRVAGSGQGATQLAFDCGDACEPIPLIVIDISLAKGTTCGPEGSPPVSDAQGLITWSAGPSDTAPASITETFWRIEGDSLVRGSSWSYDAHDAASSATDLCGSPVFWPEDFPVYPFEPAQQPAEGTDIGLERNLCNAERAGGLELVPGAPADVAWTGYLVNAQGKCSRNTEAQEWVVAIDVTGDGMADASTPIPDPSCPYVSCGPLGGTDLDADGDQELIVNTFFSIVDHTYFSVSRTDAGVSIAPILVAAPGNPDAGIQPGEPLQTSAAGDAGFAGWIRCEGYPDSPVLVATWSNWPIESDLPREWHETKLQLQEDGMFHVISTNDFELPWDQDPGLIRSDAPACGIGFNLWANPPE
jgi:hypothetical protein